jgi:TP901 family phage tail tape measure protein
MSAEIEELVVKIAGDARALEKALKTAEKSVKSFAAKAGASMKKVGKGMQDVGKSMTKYITAPLAAIGAVGLHAFAKFEDNLTKATAIMKVSTEELKQMKAAAIEVGNTTTISAQSAAEAYYFLASAGLTAAETIKALPIVSNLAIAGNFDMATATDLVTDAQSALGLSVGSTAQKMKEMTRVSDVLTQANIMANASIEQYAIALTSKAGAALKAVNKTIEEGVAILAVMADQGVKAQLAGNSLNRMLLMLQQSAQRNAKQHKILGFAVYDSAGQMRNMADIIRNLETVLSGMSAEQKAATMTEMGFAAEVQAVINPLLGQSKALKDKQAALEDAAGKTQEVADKQLKSFSAQMKIMWNQIRNAAMEIGEKLAPMIVYLSEKIKASLEWWKKQSDGFKTTVFWVGMFLAVLGPVILAIGTLIVMIGGTTAALAAMATAYGFSSITAMALAAAQWVLNVAMMAFPLFAIIAAAVAFYALLDAIGLTSDAYDELAAAEERRNKLNKEAEELRTKEREMIDASIASEDDPAVKIARLADELKRAEKNVEGYKWGVGNAHNEAKKLKPTWKSFGQAGKEVWKVQVKMAEEMEDRLEDGKERAKELKEQLAAAKEEQAALTALSASSGIGSQDQMLIVEEQYKNLKDMNEELALQEATVGMTKGEIELYKAEQNGASEATLDVLRAVEMENAILRESIEVKSAAVKATQEAAKAEEKLEADVKKTSQGMSDSIAVWGMTSREAQIYKLEMRGATEEELEMARALNAKLTELEKEKKALDENKALMKKGEQITKSLRTEEERMTDGKEDLEEMLKAGAIDLETYDRAMIQLHEDTKKDIKIKFKVSGVEAVIAGTADAAARLEEFRALSKKQDEDPPVDFKEQGRQIQAAGQDEKVERAFKSLQPTEADKAIKVAADKELARQQAEEEAAAKLAEEKKAARAAELEAIRVMVQDNKDVAGIRAMLNEMNEQQIAQVFGEQLSSGIFKSMDEDEFGNVGADFLKANIEEFRRIKDEAEVVTGLTRSKEEGGIGMTQEGAKQMIADQGIEGARALLTPLKEPIKAAGDATKMDMVKSATVAAAFKEGDEMGNMDEALQAIKDSTNKMAENNLVVIEPANIGT